MRASRMLATRFDREAELAIVVNRRIEPRHENDEMVNSGDHGPLPPPSVASARAFVVLSLADVACPVYAPEFTIVVNSGADFAGEITLEPGTQRGEEAHRVALVAEARIPGDADVGNGTNAHRAIRDERDLAHAVHRDDGGLSRRDNRHREDGAER